MQNLAIKDQELETAIVNSYPSGVRALRHRDFINSPKYNEQQWRATRSNCQPDIMLFEHVFLHRLRKLGIPFFCHCMYRSPNDQTEMFVKGVSQLKGNNAPHPKGAAVDLIHSLKGWNISDKSWEMIGHIGQEVARQNGLKVRWGGDWDSDGIPVFKDDDERFWDPAHWELENWRDL